MTKFLKRMMLLALLSVPWVSQAQTHYNVQVGSGTDQYQYVPNYTYYNYSYSQMLYTANEIGINGVIDTLAFQVASGGSTRSLTIYMAEVGQTALASQVSAADLTEVFHGSVTWAQGWVYIPLNTTFDYQDTGSLVIAVLDSTGTWASGYPYFAGTTMTDTRSRYIYQDNTPYDASSTMSYTSGFLPNIILGLTSDAVYCAAPSDVVVYDINNDEATISWVENGTASTYELVLSDTLLSASDLANATSITVYDTFYTVSNLAGNTQYYVYVRAVCDASSTSGWTAATSFRSACVGYTTIPYTDGFESLATGEMPNCWQQVATGTSGAGTFPSAYVYASNARNSNVYFEFESNSGETEIAALPAMDNISGLMLTFYASVMNANFTLEAGVLEGTTFVPVQTVQLTPGINNNWAGSYYPYTVYFSNYSGSGERMALRVTSTGSYTLMIDDLSVDYIPNCPNPTNLTLDSVGTDWAAISWTENGSASTWVVEYDTVDFLPGSGSGATVQNVQSYENLLSGLDSGRTYFVYVRSDCSGDTSTYVSLSFTTLAGAPAFIPFSCDFEQDGANGWNLLVDGQTNYWMVGSAVNNGGTRSLYVTNDGTANAYSHTISYSYAIRNINIYEAGEYAYSYDWRNQGESGYYDYIRVFLAPASAEFNAGSVLGGSCYSFSTYTIPSTWFDLSGKTSSPWTLAQSSSWQTVNGTFTLTTPGSYQLVFVWANDGGGGSNPPAAIDNVQLVRNTCPQPFNIVVTDVTTTDVTISWQTVGEETSWEVFDGTNSYLASDTSYTVTGLTPDHDYTFRVRAICDVDDTSMAISTTARTLQSCFRPVSISIDSVLGDTVWVSWVDTTNTMLYDLVFGPAGFDPDTAVDNVVTGISDSTYMFYGLTLGQRYDFYVRVDCGSEQSSWVGPASAVPSYQYVMAATGSDTIHVCGYTIYDNGGADGNYSSSCNSTLVVYPSDPTMSPVLSGSVNTESCCDHLYIYDGIGTSGTLLYQGEGTTSFSNIHSDMGVVTIHFTSDGSIQYGGFEINVACEPLPECPHPTLVAVNNINTQSADISWVENGTATEWILMYDTQNFTPSDTANVNTLLVSTNPYTLTGLDSATTYYVYVASYCNPDTSRYTGISFNTLAATPATLPYSCDFEQEGVNGWDLVNGTQSNYWTVDSAVNNGGSRSLYITNNGTTNGYTISTSSVVFASRTLYFDSVGEYAYSFDWRANGESCCDYLRAALVPTTVDLTAGTLDSWGTTSLPSGSIALDGGSKLNVSSSWNTQTGTVNVNTTGAYNLVFLWRNDGSVGTQPPAAIDNVSINMLSCPSPTNLAITRITSDSVYLSWNANGAQGPWLVSYDSITITENGTSAAIGGLTTGNSYTFSVSTLCGGNDTSYAVSIQAVPGSWNMRPNYTDTLYMCGGIIYDDGGANGTYSNSQDSYVALCPDAPNNLISVSGTSYTEGSWDYVTIYDGIGTSGTVLWTDNGVSSNQTFGPIESLSGPLTIAFHSDGSVTYDGFAINVSCVTTSCRVMNLAVDTNVAESGTQLALTWDAVDGAQQYEIEYGTTGFEHGQGQTMTSTTNSAVITGLSTLTAYDVYVRSLCSGGDTGTWAFIHLQTAMCDNPVQVVNYVDSLQNSSTSSYSPIGYSLYDYSYVQTIIPADRLSDLNGAEITALAFNPTSTDGGEEYTGMNVWMANVSDDDLSAGFILFDPTSSNFKQVVVNGDFSYSSTGWQIHPLDSTFTWDGTSNILISVNRLDGSWNTTPSFAAHQDTVARMRYLYQDDTPYDPATVSGGTASTTVGDIMLISCGAGCARPSGLSATNVTYNGATLNWGGSAATYEVAVKAVTEGTWPAPTAVNGATTFAATGLAPATQYQFMVRAICDANEGLVSDWVLGTFTTADLPCFEPTALQANPSYTTAIFSWNAGGEETQWVLHVWNSTFDQEYTVDAKPYTVTGLTQSVTYNAAVKAVCGNGAAESEYSDTISFTTVTCTVVTGVTATVTSGTTATVSWTPTGASVYEVNYGNRGFQQGGGRTITVNDVTTCTITDLEPASNYDIYVRALCETGVYGGWSSVAQITTPDQEGISTADGMNISIYPNPTTSSTTIALSGVAGEVVITIVDMNGRVVMSDSMSCEGDCTKTLEVTGLAQGAYFVRISGENVNMVKKLVVK